MKLKFNGDIVPLDESLNFEERAMLVDSLIKQYKLKSDNTSNYRMKIALDVLATYLLKGNEKEHDILSRRRERRIHDEREIYTSHLSNGMMDRLGMA